MPSINIARERSLYSQGADRGTPALRRELAQLREQMSTGKKINRASDGPAAFSVARRMEALSGQYARNQCSIEAARPWVNATQDTLNGLADLLSEAYQEGLRAANDARSDDDREVIAQRLESLKAEAVDQLNASFDGEHLFAGNRTDQPPFDADGNPTASYAEIDGARTRTVGPGTELPVNVSGARLHQVSGGFTVTGALDDLIGATRSGEKDTLETALSRTERARDHVADLGAAAGSTAQRLTAAEEQLSAAIERTESRRSEAEDADYLETLTQVQQTETRLQAALKTTASVLQTSLLDYLR